MKAETQRTESGNSLLTWPRNPRISALWPDGGVVTQRTANPHSPRINPPFFPTFAVCSSGCAPRRAAAEWKLARHLSRAR